MAGLPREVIKWIQSLDLSWEINIPKWDLSNGYLIGEMFSWYYPAISMRCFMRGNSFEIKTLNWHKLKKFLRKKRFRFSEDLIEGTIHCWEGAAAMLVQQVYEMLTKRRIHSKRNPERVVDFTDQAYQRRLPFICRATATSTVQNNTKLTEILADGCRIKVATKARRLMAMHTDHRREDRKLDPARYGITPSLGERAVRREPTVETRESTFMSGPPVPPIPPHDTISGMSRGPSNVQFVEIAVNQTNKNTLPTISAY